MCVPRRPRRIVVCNVHSAWCVKDLWMGGLKIGRLSFIPLFPDCRFVSQTTGKILRKRVSVKDLREKGCQNMKGPLPHHMPYSPSKEIVGYQPISFFCNRENLILVRPLVKRSPSWSSVSILTNSMQRGPMCSLNQ